MNPEKMICVCYDIKYKDLLACVKEGSKTLEDIIEKTKATTACKICEKTVEKYLAVALDEFSNEF